MYFSNVNVKWAWAGHVCRWGDGRWSKGVLEWSLRDGKRSVGGQFAWWSDDMLLKKKISQTPFMLESLMQQKNSEETWNWKIRRYLSNLGSHTWWNSDDAVRVIASRQIVHGVGAQDGDMKLQGSVSVLLHSARKLSVLTSRLLLNRITLHSARCNCRKIGAR